MSALILLVEDDLAIAQIERLYMLKAGYRITLCADGGQAVELAQREQPDLIILDRLLPEKDGLQICKEIRLHSQVPIIMVTALTDEQDRLDGFAAGVDDYICKPFHPAEMIARIQAVLRRASLPETDRAESGLRLDQDSLCLVTGRQRIGLTRSEFNILSHLMRYPGRIMTRDEILEHCFPDKGGNSFDRTIDNHVLNIRKKLAAALPGRELIHSAYGSGYFFSEQTPQQ